MPALVKIPDFRKEGNIQTVKMYEPQTVKECAGFKNILKEKSSKECVLYNTET